MMTNNIQTEHDVIKNSPADESFSTSAICPQIGRIERVAFNSCFLGMDKYKALKEDMVDVNSFELYEVRPYAINENVIYGGKHYKNTIEANEGNPDDDGWVPVDKFITDANNELWHEGGMKYWLAFLVFHASMAYGTYKTGAKGTTKVEDDGAGNVSVTFKEYTSFKDKIKHDADDQLDLLYVFMKDAGMLGECEVECKPPRKKRKRRFHFRNNN